jgi:hypothetical protein
VSLVCARCAQENPDGFRFCGACGATLEAAAAREVRTVARTAYEHAARICDEKGAVPFADRARALIPEL